MIHKNIDFRYFYFIILFFFLLFFNYDKNWCIFQKIVSFESWSVYGDLRLLLKGVDFYRIGKNPFLQNYTPPYNYPSSWRFFSIFPFFNSINYKIIGFTLIVLSQFLFLILSGGWLTFKKTIIYLLILLSPTSLLIFERGNNDLIIYIMVIFSVLFLPDVLVAVIFYLAFVLKLYPLGLFAVLLFLFSRLNKRNVAILSAFIMGVATYLLCYKEEIFLIMKNTPSSFREFTFGLMLPIRNIISKNPKMVELDFLYTSLYILIIIMLCYYFVKKTLPKVDFKIGVEIKDSKMKAFIAGAGIFMFSFIFSISWEYRMFFLTLCIPAIIEFYNSKVFGAKYLLITIPVIFWNQTFRLFWESVISRNSDIVFLVNQFLVLSVFFMLFVYIIKIFRLKFNLLKI